MHKYTVASCCLLILLVAGAVSLPQLTVAEDLGLIPKSAQVAILRDPGTPALGAKSADVTLVEYFDYNCPFCKKLNPALQGLLASDPRVALVYKDWPILSETSKYAAGLALAAKWQDKYGMAHDTLMGATHLASNEQVDALLKGAGLDLGQLKKDRASRGAAIDALLKRNDTEVRALGIRGTPGLLVGRHIINGIYDVPGLEKAVALARAALSAQ